MIILFACVFIAGFIDSIAGGGGLITLPAYCAFGLPPHFALGTNKFSASLATILSSYRFIKSKAFVARVAIPACIASLIFSVFGTKTALLVDEKILQLVLIFAVPAIAGFILFKKDFGSKKETNISDKKIIFLSLLIGAIMGFYDGFFGPGTGTFYIILFSSVLGIDITSSCGTARVANLASNIASMITFIINGKVMFSIGIPCAIFSMAGSWLGTGCAINGGIKVVKPALLVIMIILVGKITYETFLI